jgi:hypothetical protein
VGAAVREVFPELLAQMDPFSNAFRIAPWGDYVEFGVYDGSSMINAYYSRLQIVNGYLSGQWDHASANPEEMKKRIREKWARQRFIGFDSFEGIPESRGVDSVRPVFPKGSYACDEATFRRNLRKAGVPRDKVIAVKGWFQDVLTPQTRERLQLKEVSVVNIDSDLYESARLALEFVTPALQDGSIILFDEWYQFNGNPQLGEQRAFYEWRDRNPDLILAEFKDFGFWSKSFIASRRIEVPK